MWSRTSGGDASKRRGSSRSLPSPPSPRDQVTVAPDIAIEIVSPSPRDQKRDRIEKLDEYAAFGVKYYWLVDPQLRAIEVLALGADGRYVHAQNITTGTADVVGCDDLRLDADDLWRDVEAAEAEDGSA